LRRVAAVEAASRVLVSRLPTRHLQDLADRDDLVGIRRAVNGSGKGLEAFTPAYRKALSALASTAPVQTAAAR